WPLHCLDARDACSCCSRFVEYGGFSGRNAPPARGTSTDAILLFETGANKNFSTKLAIQPTKLRQPTCGKPWAIGHETRCLCRRDGRNIVWRLAAHKGCDGSHDDGHDAIAVVPGRHLEKQRAYLPKQVSPLFYRWISGRDGGIRTRDPLHPMQVRYQAALRPERTRVYQNKKKPASHEAGFLSIATRAS